MVKAIVSSEPGVSPVTYFDFSKEEDAVLCDPGTCQKIRLALKPIEDAGSPQARRAATDRIVDAALSKGILSWCRTFISRQGVRLTVPVREQSTTLKRVEAAIAGIKIIAPWTRARSVVSAQWHQATMVKPKIVDALGMPDAAALVGPITQALQASFSQNPEALRWSLLSRVHRDATLISIAVNKNQDILGLYQRALVAKLARCSALQNAAEVLQQVSAHPCNACAKICVDERLLVLSPPESAPDGAQDVRLCSECVTTLKTRSGQQFSGEHDARSVGVPTLCLAGAEDTLTPPAEVEATARALLRQGPGR